MLYPLSFRNWSNDLKVGSEGLGDEGGDCDAAGELLEERTGEDAGGVPEEELEAEELDVEEDTTAGEGFVREVVEPGPAASTADEPPALATLAVVACASVGCCPVLEAASTTLPSTTPRLQREEPPGPPSLSRILVKPLGSPCFPTVVRIEPSEDWRVSVRSSGGRLRCRETSRRRSDSELVGQRESRQRPALLNTRTTIAQDDEEEEEEEAIDMICF